ncbi:hypothetical protein QYM36_011732 [Artemia franciscana]|uniref:Uncharacterized protein n=1 Tax=Artemia franciscana TaxID=6661 RepID=A0AA88HP95_ARTSF|nr:hypothetical protein QYM36_011732 [Artemia franciscana]
MKTYPTLKLWLEYIRMVLIILQLLLADRCGNFDLDLKAASMMLPFMASGGHHKYATYLTMYLQDMSTMPWSLNLEAKQKGGIKGLTLNTSAVTKWISTLPFCANVSAPVCKLAGINGNSEYDGSEKADFQNEKFVLKTVSVVESYVNPLDCKEKELVNIMTSEVAKNSIRNSLLAAEENGVRAVEAFVAGQPNPFSKIKVVTMASSLMKGKEQKKKAFSCIKEELEVTRT